MMKRFLFAALAALSLVGVAHAQTNGQAYVDQPILNGYNLNTPTLTATTNYVVTSTNVVNSTYTIAHQPDTPRNVTGTVTDTTPSIVGGTITIVGTDVNGNAQTEVWTLTSLTFTGTDVWKTITSITGAGITVLGGAGDETVVMGVGSSTGYIYCALSDPPVAASGRIKTSGSSTTITAVTGLGTDTPFSQIGVGDEITATGPIGQFRSVVTAKASSASITVFSAVDLSGQGTTPGYQWSYRTLTCGYSDTSGWVSVHPGDKSLGIVVRQATDTGGVSYQIEGNMRGGSGAPVKLTSGNFSTVAVAGLPDNTSGNAFAIVDAVSRVRVGLKFGTTDDSSDTGTEAIDVYLTYQTR